MSRNPVTGGGDASGHRLWLVRGVPAIFESCAPGDICSTRRGEAGAARAARARRGARLRSRCERRSIEVRGEDACTLRTPPAPRSPERAREPVQLGCTFSRRFGRTLHTSCACGRPCPTNLPPLCLAGRGRPAEHSRRLYGSQLRNQSADFSIYPDGAPAPMTRLGALNWAREPIWPALSH